MTSPALPKLHPDFSYRVDYVGNEKNPIIVIDNFIEHAESLIEFAENFCKFQISPYLYPGIQASSPPAYREAFYENMKQLLCTVFDIKVENIVQLVSYFAMALLKPEQLLPCQSRPHVDSDSCVQFAAVHYLCDEDKGGTSVYRHKATGFETIDSSRRAEYDHYLLKEEEDNAWQKKYITGSNDYYEQIGSYEAKFNRLVIYKSNLLHSANLPPNFSFDDRPRFGRLTLTSFIQCREPENR